MIRVIFCPNLKHLVDVCRSNLTCKTTVYPRSVMSDLANSCSVILPTVLSQMTPYKSNAYNPLPRLANSSCLWYRNRTVCCILTRVTTFCCLVEFLQTRISLPNIRSTYSYFRVFVWSHFAWMPVAF